MCLNFYIGLKLGFPVQINRICYRSLMQTEKSQPEGKRIMPETKFTEFPALFVDQRLEFLGLHRRLMFDIFFLSLTLKAIIYHSLFLLFWTFYVATERPSPFDGFHGGA